MRAAAPPQTVFALVASLNTRAQLAAAVRAQPRLKFEYKAVGDTASQQCLIWENTTVAAIFSLHGGKVSDNRANALPTNCGESRRRYLYIHGQECSEALMEL